MLRKVGVVLGVIVTVLFLPSHAWSVEASTAGPDTATATHSAPASEPGSSSSSPAPTSSEPSPSSDTEPASSSESDEPERVSREYVEQRDGLILLGLGLCVFLLGAHVVGSWGS